MHEFDCGGESTYSARGSSIVPTADCFIVVVIHDCYTDSPKAHDSAMLLGQSTSASEETYSLLVTIRWPFMSHSNIFAMRPDQFCT